jgi:cephalosporin-C deacetylase
MRYSFFKRSAAAFLLMAQFLFVQAYAQKKPPPDYVIQVTTGKEDAMYKQGEKVTFTIKVFYKNEQLRESKIKWRITKDGLEPALQSGQSELKDGSLVLTGTLNEPGFLQCRADLADPSAKAPTGRGGAAFDPLQIKASLPPPADFNKYWDEQKKILAAIPLNIRITPVKSPIEGVECFDVQADGYRGPMSAYMARPVNAKPKSLPAMLLTHGAGVASSRLGVAARWAQDGFLALDFNAHGLPNGWPQAQYNQLYKDSLTQYFLRNPESQDSVFFHVLYMRLLRALDVLTMQPEWDQRILVANGRSQGGGQALVAAGLDKRITFLAAQILPCVTIPAWPLAASMAGPNWCRWMRTESPMPKHCRSPVM